MIAMARISNYRIPITLLGGVSASESVLLVLHLSEKPLTRCVEREVAVGKSAQSYSHIFPSACASRIAEP
jgi:hypothetical protein